MQAMHEKREARVIWARGGTDPRAQGYWGVSVRGGNFKTILSRKTPRAGKHPRQVFFFDVCIPPKSESPDYVASCPDI